MTVRSPSLRAFVAFVLAVIAALFAWIFMGACVPFVLMALLHGADGSVGDGLIVVLTLPVAAFFGLFVLVVGTGVLYRKLSPRYL